MLISFTVSNYKSILEPVTLNMVADEDDITYSNTLIKGTDGLVNPISVIYGPNGSGKHIISEGISLLIAMITTFLTGRKKYQMSLSLTM